MKSRTILAVLALAITTINSQLSTARAQGSLTPPGAPAPTMKTLAQIEPRTPISSLPYTITSPGAYYVTTNLTGVSGQSGINISANDVTLDLSGFTLSGGAGTLRGIFITYSYTNIVIRNGTVIGWGGNGVDGFSFGYPRNVTYEHLNIYGNAGYYGLAAEATSRIQDCQAMENTWDGIFSVGGIISDCVARENGNYGIEAHNSEVRSCLAHYNTNGFYADNSTITECDILNNVNNGIVIGSSCRVMNNRIANHSNINADAILIQGTYNYIAENSILNNAFALNAGGAGVTNNCIIQNRFLLSTQTVVNGNNMFPIVEMGPVSGGSFANTNSFINIIYP